MKTQSTKAMQRRVNKNRKKEKEKNPTLKVDLKRWIWRSDLNFMRSVQS